MGERTTYFSAIQRAKRRAATDKENSLSEGLKRKKVIYNLSFDKEDGKISPERNMWLRKYRPS